MEIDLSEYIGEYVAELFEQLDELQSLLLDLEKKPEDASVINEIFRIAHTIKGSAATMGFDLIASVSHAFEDLLGEIRDGNKKVTEPIFKAFFEAYDCIKIQANCIPDDLPLPKDLDIRAVEAKLKKFSEEVIPVTVEETVIDVMDRLSDATNDTSPDNRVHSDIATKSQSGQAELTLDGKTAYHIKMIFEADMDMKSVRAFLVLNHLHDQGDIIQILPSEKDIEDDKLDEVMELILNAENTDEEEIRAILGFGEAREIGVTKVSPDYRIDINTFSPKANRGAGLPPAQAVPKQSQTSATQTQTGLSHTQSAAPTTQSGTSQTQGAAPTTQSGTSQTQGSTPKTQSGTSQTQGSAQYTHTGTSTPGAPFQKPLAYEESDQEQFLKKILGGSPSTETKVSQQPKMTSQQQAAHQPSQGTQQTSQGTQDPTNIFESPSSIQTADNQHRAQNSQQYYPSSNQWELSEEAQQRALEGRNLPQDLNASGDLRFTQGEKEAASRLIDKLSEDQKNLVIESINQDLNVFELNVQFRDDRDHSMLRALTVSNYMADMSRVIISRPTRVELDSGYFSGTLQLIISTEKEISQLRELLLAEEISRTSFWPISLEGLEIVSLEVAQPGQTTSSASITASAISKNSEQASPDRNAGVPTVRVTVDRLDSLMNLVGELVIKKTQLNQIYTEFEQSKDVDELQKSIHDLNQGLERITSDLQSGIMKVRMVQIGQVFYRFARLVRDLSKNLGKEVEFLIEGAETELDKTVIDEIGDPLMHLIRNCLDHGIEPPEVRKRLGKSEKGILLLRAQHAGNHIIVEAADDGAGIDSERVKKKAIDKGFITAAEAARMSQTEINGLIFLPGFSTSGEVTNVSGRGVGMDVVKETIDKLQGDIQIKSERNVGTTIQIKLPLTLAIIQGLLVRVANERFTIPLSTVAETIQMAQVKIHTINNQKVVTIRDEVVPLIYLQEFFRLEPRPDDNKFFIVLAGDVDTKVGLVVNYLYGKQEIVIKSLDRRFASVKGFAGGTVLGDGKVSLILDIPALIEESSRIYSSTTSKELSSAKGLLKAKP